jgi:pyridoxine 5-phosphate synthase
VVGLAVDLGFVGALRAADAGRDLDPAVVAHRVELAGADLVVIPLGSDGEDGAAGGAGDPDGGRCLTEAEAVRVAAILRGKVCVSLRGTARLDAALRLRPAEILLQGDDGGPLPLALGAAAGEVGRATVRAREAGVVPVLSVRPTVEAVMAAQDAGAGLVELHAGDFASAAGDEAAVVAFLRLSGAAREAAEVGMRVRAGGGFPRGARLARLAEVREVETVRVGPPLLARAVYEGLTAAVAALRAEIDRGARRGDRGEEEE